MTRNRVKEIAEQKDITLRDLIALTGIRADAIMAVWYNEQTDTKQSTYEKIAKVLEVPLSDLFQSH